MVNLNAWNSLPDDLKAIVEAAAYKCNMWMLSEFEAKNNGALQELISKHHVQLRQFPEPVLKELKKLANDVLKEVAASDPMSQKVYDSVLSFQKTMIDWNKLTEEQYQKMKYL